MLINRNLLYMRMVINMILAVAVVAVTAGTIPEFQIRVGNVGSAAYGAAVMVGSGGLCGGCFVGTSLVKMNGLLVIGGFRLPLEKSGYIDLPGNRNHVAYIFAKEQEIVGKGNQGEQVIGEYRTK